MVKISRRLLFTILAAFLILTPFVLGADILGPIFQNFKGTNLGQTYANYAPFIDAIIYMWLFITVARGALKDKLSPQVGVAIGVILGIAMCVFELNSKFNIGQLKWFAAIILFLIIGMFLFNLIKNFGGNAWLAMSVAFLVMYSLIQVMAPDLVAWIQKTGWLGTLLSILFLIAIIGLIYGIISLFKGIKSGEWGTFKAKQHEGEAEKTYKSNNRKEEIEANRKKKAAENMFKLETEMGNLNHNIGQLEQAEANSFNRNLRNRQDQIQTLSELSNALNRSWELQKQLQEAYGKASMPAYAENEGYLNTIKQSTQQLDDFLKRISELLRKLHEGVTNTEKEEREADVQLRAELDKQILDLDVTIKKYEDALKTIDTYDNTTVKNDLKIVGDVAKQRKDILLKIREAQALLEQNRNEILMRDQKNIADLKHAIEVSDANPAKNLNILVRGINIGQNAGQIKENYNSAEGFFGKVGSLINLRNQYLSGDNLQQIYQSVKNVHATLQEIVTKINEEKIQITNKNTLLKQFNDLQAVLQKRKTDIIRKHLTNVKTTFETDKAQIELFKKGIMKYYMDPLSPVASGKHAGINYKTEFKSIADTINDKLMKGLLLGETQYIQSILTQYNNHQLKGGISFNAERQKTSDSLNSTLRNIAERAAEFEVRHKNYLEVIDIETKLAQATSSSTQTQAPLRITP